MVLPSTMIDSDVSLTTEFVLPTNKDIGVSQGTNDGQLRWLVIT
jgi:hypothetical protein